MILGIWDGHDAGAAVVEKNKILVAINEERITRRKLETCFPEHSIKACLDYLGLKPTDIEHIACPTSDLSKTITRVFPCLKERYYLLRRRKIQPLFARYQKATKYRLTEFGTNKITRTVSSLLLKKRLKKMGFESKLHIIEHHLAHAFGVFTSGMKKALVITLDGVGDGLSGSVNIYENGDMYRISSIPAKHSLGIFFEHVTNLLNMRELEDEGKVMALADYAYQTKNEMEDFFSVKDLNIKAKFSSTKMFKELQKILWHTPNEEFAQMAQRTIEKHTLALFKNAIEKTGMKNVYWSGGVASNIKLNRKIRLLPEVKKWFVFPHMGDGGLALGAAIALNHEINGVSSYKLSDLYLGPDYSLETIELAVKSSGFEFEERSDIPEYAAELIQEGEIVFWFQGRMEFGPRALGNRSILTNASSEDVKNRLNLEIKKRVWFQPFCPTVLKEDSNVFEDYDAKGSGIAEKTMTMGYIIKDEFLEKMKAVINIDKSARPQLLENENKNYRRLIQRIKQLSGLGIVLNTSFNLHGYPIVNTPYEAIDVLKKTKNKFLVIGNFILTNR